MLGVRGLLALAFQVLFAVGFLIGGDPSPWRSSANWWLGSLALAEMVNLWLLTWSARREGIRLRDTVGGDLVRIPRSSGLSISAICCSKTSHRIRGVKDLSADEARYPNIFSSSLASGSETAIRLTSVTSSS